MSCPIAPIAKDTKSIPPNRCFVISFATICGDPEIGEEWHLYRLAQMLFALGVDTPREYSPTSA
eukprot:2195838-Amphidinium_carterae.1